MPEGPSSNANPRFWSPKFSNLRDISLGYMTTDYGVVRYIIRVAPSTDTNTARYISELQISNLSSSHRLNTITHNHPSPQHVYDSSPHISIWTSRTDLLQSQHPRSPERRLHVLVIIHPGPQIRCHFSRGWNALLFTMDEVSKLGKNFEDYIPYHQGTIGNWDWDRV
jgi:hypothetical protein